MTHEIKATQRSHGHATHPCMQLLYIRDEIKSAFTPKTSPKFLYKLTQSSMSSDALASDSVKHTNFVRVTITGGALNHISLRKRRGNQERFQCVEGMWEYKTKKGKTQKP